MALEDWLPSDRQRKLKPAAPPTVAQLRKRRNHAVTLLSNAMDETSRKMADRLIAAWEPANMIQLALADLAGDNALLKREALKFLQICAPDKLPTQGERINE